MAAYKNQHYLPCAYLRHFSVDGEKSSRDSKIWRTDSERHKEVPVKTQCFEQFFYSREDAEAVERGFGASEDFYGRIIQKIWSSGNPANEQEYFGLLLLMFDFHIRNVAYARNQKDNFNDYQSLAAATKTQIFFGDRSTPASDDEVVNLWRMHWAVRIVTGGSGRIFLTSDNPSMWFRACDGFGVVHLALMPVTPRAYAVAFDRRVFDAVAPSASEEDEAVLNQLQSKYSFECMFTPEQLSEAQLVGVRRLCSRRTRPDADFWSIRNVPARGGFSFLRRK